MICFNNAGHGGLFSCVYLRGRSPMVCSFFVPSILYALRCLKICQNNSSSRPGGMMGSWFILGSPCSLTKILLSYTHQPRYTGLVSMRVMVFKPMVYPPGTFVSLHFAS